MKKVCILAGVVLLASGAALFAEPISARQADQWGMIWEAVPDMGFEEHWRARARHLARDQLHPRPHTARVLPAAA